ncbi:DNA-binding transcriptional regulator DhaR [Providencia rustigianii]|uniref:DNA-binding transcriptional regulator DhaR n=1 Tax=Providencia rustigianii TaxID=158850 RepID=A0A379G664_9GAMM|nr:helix-turn-helix domain-containing protein [Providencia rustigianii]SUC36544.1 DNA-binding transcriptional regulator DhaR [Providencia rustigianii]VEB74203.1 DNA-binding transcriptional regulator DhaR [Providencia rustigianii]
MTIDFTIPKLAQLTEKSSCTISLDLLTQLASTTIIDGLKPISDLNAGALLLNSYGCVLWSNNQQGMLEKASELFLAKMGQGTQSSQPIELQGEFYYSALIYDESRLLAVVMITASQIKSNLLLALTCSLGREISEKLKSYFYWQKLSDKSEEHTLFNNLNIHDVEKALIIEAALAFGGKIQEMHQALNMGRTTLWRKLKQYQIDIRDYKL